MTQASLRKRLDRAEYASLDFRLRLLEPFELPAYGLLRLRREFSRLLRSGVAIDPEMFALIKPSLPTDPGLLRRVQQPSPGFILRVDRTEPESLAAGELLSLPVCFLGNAIKQAASFARLLDALGPVGLLDRRGRFALSAIENAHPAAAERLLWSGGELRFAAHIAELVQLLDEYPPTQTRLAFQTPARLMKKSRPLFRPDFRDIFPFLLRRVTAMLASWCDLEDLFDVPRLLAAADSLRCEENSLKWQDWRPLAHNAEAGGLCGSVHLAGPELEELWPLLKLGEMLGMGKGAAFGAGRYRLI